MAKTPFLLWSEDGSVLPLGLRLKREGHPVVLYIHAAAARNMGRGLIAKTTVPDAPSRAVVVFDAVGHGAAGAAFRKQGHPVIGGNPFDAELEKDRAAGMRLMTQAGLRVPETHPFRSTATAIGFLKSHPGQWFVKVSGDQIESSTYDAPDSETMIRYLEWCEATGTVHPFALQRRVSGTEVSLNGWFDGERFVRPFELTMEEKRAQAGDLGPRTGCESNVVWWAQGDVLAEETLLPMEDRLAREHYVGPLDLNMTLDDDGPRGLEWTARLGFDATYAWMRLIRPPLGEQLEAFARGALSEWDHEPTRALTLRITVPPYPAAPPAMLKKLEGLPLDERVLSDPAIAPIDVMESPALGAVCAGSSGIVCTVGATGERVGPMRTTVLDLAEALVIPNKQYRIDPVSRFERDWLQLKDV